MKLYAGKVDTIAAEVINTLTSDGDLEVADPHEAQLDVASVLGYLRVLELTERAGHPRDPRACPTATCSAPRSSSPSEGLRPRREALT
jgi:hypothetical protein